MARTEKVDTEAPACSAGDPTDLNASATSSPAEGLNRRAGTSKGQSLGACLVLPVAPSVRMSSGDEEGAWAFPGSQTTCVPVAAACQGRVEGRGHVDHAGDQA